jgi:signal peptidase II
MTETCPTMTGSRTKTSLLLIGLLVLILDQVTKGLVYAYLPVIDSSYYWYPYGGIGVFKNFAGIEFSINHMTNTGAAWGVLGNYQLLLIILRIGLIVGLLIYLFYFNQYSSWQLPLILIIAGALGNVIDFFVYGHVVDMFHFVLWGYDFPVFNLADSAISVGIASLFILSFAKNSSEP